MADDDKQSNIGVAAAPPPEPDEDQPGKKRSASLFSGGPATLNYGERFAGRSAWIKSAVVDGKPLGDSRGAKVSPGSEIVLLGGGLSKDNVDVWEIKQSGRLTPDPFTEWIASDDRVVLNLSRVLGGVAEGSFEIYVFSTKHGGGVRKLPVKFIYQKAEEPKDSKAAGEKDDSDKTGARPRAGAGGGVDLGGGLMDTFKQAAQTAVTEPVRQFAVGLEGGKKSVQAQQKTAQTSASGGASSAVAKAKVEADVDDGAGDEIIGEETVGGAVSRDASVGGGVETSVSGTTSTVQAGGQTISQAGTVQAGGGTIRTSGAVQTGASGSVGGAVQGTASQIISAGGTTSVSSQGADVSAKIKSEASSQSAVRASGQAGGTIKTSTEIEAGGKTSVQGQKVAGAGGGLAQSGQAGTKTQAQANVNADIETSVQAKAASEGKASVGAKSAVGAKVKQSAEEAGEYLYNNPQLIQDTSARNRILQALATGNAGSLPGDDRKLLISVLQKIAQDPKQPASLRQASQITADSAQGAALPGEEMAPKRAEKPLAAAGGEPLAPAQPYEPPKGETAPAEKASPLEEAKKAEVLNLPHKEEYKKQMAAMHGRDKAMDAALGRPGSPAAAAGQPLSKESPATDKVRDSAPLGGGLPGEEKKSPTAPSEREGLGLPKQEAGAPESGAGKPVLPALPGRPESGEQKEEGGKGPKKEPEPSREKDTGQEDEDAGSDQANNIEQAQRILQDERGVKSFNVKEAESILNKELSMLLNRAAIGIWLAAIPSFGASILLGAILGDIIWILGPKVVASTSRLASWAAAKVPGLSKGVREKFDVKSINLELSASVKANIIAMNLAVIALVFVLVAIIGSVIWGVCNKVPYLAKETVGVESYCESFNQSFVGRSVNYVATGSAGYEPSNNTPGNLINTQKWTEAINNAAQKYNIDACILRVVVQAESGGNPNVIGCDCAFNGKPAACYQGRANMDYSSSYQFNWNECSYGIGLTQWTIFPKGGSGYRAWSDSLTPSRNIAGQWYTVTQLLNPLTSLDLTANVFRQNLSNARGDVAAAFAAYAGQSAYTQTFVNQRMALYNLCISQR